MSSKDNEPATRPECYTDNCCFCISLKTGCFTLGYMGLISMILAIIFTAYGTGTLLQVTKDTPKLHYMVPMVTAIMVVLLSIFALSLIFNIVLLVGLHNDKPGCVKAFLIYNVVFLIVYAIIAAVMTIMGYSDMASTITRVLQILVSIYFLIVIRSYYYVMKGKVEQSP